MTKEEFYSNIREYKASKSLKHGNDPEVWERDSFDFAVAALTKSKLAKYAGEATDASRFETEYNGYMNKLAHMDERAAKALEQKVLASAEAKYRECLTKLIAAKHSDEPISLSHGTKWKNHKYLRIENGRYIYPDDEKIKNSKEKKYVVLRKEAYKKSNDANIAATLGGNSSKNDIAAAITRSQASGMRRTADLLEAQMNEQKRREQESKNEAKEAEVEDKVRILKDSMEPNNGMGRSPLSQKDKESYSDLENKVRNKCKEFYSKFGNADVKVYKDSLGRVSSVEVWTDEKEGKSSSETFYMDWEQKVKHSLDPITNFYAAVEDYLDKNKVEHHGVLGQKWGIRRYQNEDGTLTDAGKAKLQGYYDKGKDKKAERTFEKWTKNNLTDDENKQILKKSTIGQLLGGPIANAIGGTRELSKIRSSEAYNARLSKAIKLLNSSDYGKKLKSMVTKKSSQPKQDDIQKRVAELDSQVWKNIAAYAKKTGSTAGYDLSKDESWLEAERLLRNNKR